MTMFIAISSIIVFVFFVIPALSSNKTKLFRRVWSSEYAMGGNTLLNGTYGHLAEAQDVAVRALMKHYNIIPSLSVHDLTQPIASLMADALQFDMRNSRNFGVEVTPVLAREIRKRCPNLASSASTGFSE